MLMFISFIAMTVFMFGLWSWAQSGSTLWQIFRIKRNSDFMTYDEKQKANADLKRYPGNYSHYEKVREVELETLIQKYEIQQAEIKKLETFTDRALRTSLKLIGFMALFVWLFLGVTTVLNMFGVDLIGSLTARAQKYWASPEVASKNAAKNRNSTLKALSSGVRK